MNRSFTPEELDGLNRMLAEVAGNIKEWHDEESRLLIVGAGVVCSDAAAAIAFLRTQLAHKTQAQPPSAAAMQAAFDVWSKASGDFDWSKLLRAAYEADDVVPRARLSECEREKDEAQATFEDEQAAHGDTLRLLRNAQTRAEAAERDARALREALEKISEQTKVKRDDSLMIDAFYEIKYIATVALANLVAPPPGPEESPNTTKEGSK